MRRKNDASEHEMEVFSKFVDSIQQNGRFDPVNNVDAAECLDEIRQEMHSLLCEAREVVDRVGGVIRASANAFWITYINDSLGHGDGNLLGMHTMLDTIDALRKGGSKDE